MIKARFPAAPAWGQAGSDGGGNVTAVLAAMGIAPAVLKIRQGSLCGVVGLGCVRRVGPARLETS